MSYHEGRENCHQKHYSKAKLDIPHGATIKAAYLYWSASGSIKGTAKVKLNRHDVYASKQWYGGYQSYQFYGAMADVTDIVTKSGDYYVSNIWHYISRQMCYGNAAYSAWSMVVVYSHEQKPESHVSFCYDDFDFTFPSGKYGSSVGCISPEPKCKAKTTVVTFESDAYKGEHFYIGAQNMGDNLFHGSTAPNLDIRTFDATPQLADGHLTSLRYELHSYLTYTKYKWAVEGLFMPIRVLMYTSDC